MNTTPALRWLAICDDKQPDQLRIKFQEHHLGNPLIRSIHGGVVGSLIEQTAIHALANALAEKGRSADLELTTSTFEYLRVTKDDDLMARAEITRVARRVAFMNVYCWQDSEDLPVAHGTCTIRIAENTAQEPDR